MTAIDVVAKWAIDAALFLVAAAGFMVASFAGDLAARAIISITVGIVVGLLLEQITSTLPSSARLANVSALPDGVRRMSRGRYAFEGTCWFVPVYALVAVLAWAWGDPKLYGWLGGWLAALAIVRLYGAVRARRVEQLDRVVLLIGMGPWRRRVVGYYAARTTGAPLSPPADASGG